MAEANCRRFVIDNVNRAAIGHMNSEGDLFVIGDDPVITGKFLIARESSIDHSRAIKNLPVMTGSSPITKRSPSEFMWPIAARFTLSITKRRQLASAIPVGKEPSERLSQ